MLHKKTPFLRIVIPLCAGIISGLWVKPDTGWFIITGVLIAILLVLSIRTTKKSEDNIYGIILFASIFLAGNILYSLKKNSVTPLPEKEICLIAEVSDYPEIKEKSIRVHASLFFLKDSTEWKEISGSVILYLEKDSSLYLWLPGDIFEVKCRPSEIKNRGNPSEFNYRFYMQNKGILSTAYAKSGDISRHIIPGHRHLRHKALIIRNRITDIYRENGITGPTLALVAAMTLGDKTLLEPEQKESFMKAGVMHIMAVSGLHAVILSMFVFNVLFFLKGKTEIIRIIAALIILWAFAFITGLTPSVLRATIMFSFIQAGKLLKRPSDSMNSVFASAFVLIIADPRVIFDAGFLLSYSAVIFIIGFYRELYSRLRFSNRLTDLIWQSAAVTITAQAGTLPLTIMYFNMFSAYFLLTNLFIVPLSSLLIIISCLIPLFHSIKFLALFFAFIAGHLATLTGFLTEGASSLPGALIENIGLTLPECVIAGCVITLMFIVILMKKPSGQSVIYLLMLVLAISVTVRRIAMKRSSELIVFNTQGTANIGVRTGKKLLLLTNSEILPYAVNQYAGSKGLDIIRILYEHRPTIIKAGDFRILVNDRYGDKIVKNSAHDILIINGTISESEAKTIIENKEQTIILSAFNPYPKRPEYIESDHASGNPHFVTLSGAFLKPL